MEPVRGSSAGPDVTSQHFPASTDPQSDMEVVVRRCGELANKVRLALARDSRGSTASGPSQPGMQRVRSRTPRAS